MLAMKYILISIVAMAITCASVEYQPQKVKLTLFYEALCPFSIDFIRKQLFPTSQLLPDLLAVDLVPYGNAKAVQLNGVWKFNCQHGPRECYANKFHACALEQSKYKNLTSTISLISCFMKTDYLSYDLQKCCRENNFSVDRLSRCMLTKADNLLAKYAEQTVMNIPSIRFVPMLMINNQYSEELNQEAMDNLVQVICKLTHYVSPACNVIDVKPQVLEINATNK